MDALSSNCLIKWKCSNFLHKWKQKHWVRRTCTPVVAAKRRIRSIFEDEVGEDLSFAKLIISIFKRAKHEGKTFKYSSPYYVHQKLIERIWGRWSLDKRDLGCTWLTVVLWCWLWGHEFMNLKLFNLLSIKFFSLILILFFLTKKSAAILSSL